MSDELFFSYSYLCILNFKFDSSLVRMISRDHPIVIRICSFSHTHTHYFRSPHWNLKQKDTRNTWHGRFSFMNSIRCNDRFVDFNHTIKLILFARLPLAIWHPSFFWNVRHLMFEKLKDLPKWNDQNYN